MGSRLYFKVISPSADFPIRGIRRTFLIFPKNPWYTLCQKADKMKRTHRERRIYIGRLEKLARGKAGAPSWIVSFRPKREGIDEDAFDQGLYRAKSYKDTWTVNTELQDDGEWFGGGSGAIIDHGRDVMIGTGLYDSNGAFICRK